MNEINVKSNTVFPRRGRAFPQKLRTNKLPVTRVFILRMRSLGQNGPLQRNTVLTVSGITLRSIHSALIFKIYG